MSEIKKSPDGLPKKRAPREKTSRQIIQDVEDVTRAARAGAMATIEEQENFLNSPDAQIKRAMKGDKYIYVDKDDNNILKGEMADGVDEAYPFHEGVGIVIIGEKFFYLDQNGTSILKGAMANGLSGVNAFHEGVGLVKFKDKFYYLDKNGNRAVLKGDMADGVDDASDFVNGNARVLFNGKVYVIDKNGDQVPDDLIRYNPGSMGV